MHTSSLIDTLISAISDFHPVNILVDNPYLEVDKKIVSEVYTSTEPMDNLKVLCDVYGSRFPGTPGDLGSVKWMVEKLKSYGVGNAHYESYMIPGWKRGPATLEVTSPLEKEFDCISLPHSIGGEVEADLVFLGDGPIDVLIRARNDTSHAMNFAAWIWSADQWNSYLMTQRAWYGIFLGAILALSLAMCGTSNSPM